jgi:transposase
VPRSRPPYPVEFRAEAVRLVRASPERSIPQLAKELGVSGQSLRNWVRQADVDAGRREGPTSEEREELRRLARRTASCARSARSLKKAAAFFASESETR